MAAGSWYAVHLWDVASTTRLNTFEHPRGVRDVAFSPNSQWLASAGEDNTVRLWHIGSGVALFTLTEHNDWVNSVAFSPDNQTLATGSRDNTVRLWNVATPLSTLEHNSSVNSVVFSPDGQWLASGSSDNRVRLWDVATAARLATFGHNNGINSVAFSPDGLTLAAGSFNAVHVWDLGSGALRNTFEHTDWVQSVTFSPEGTILASGGEDGTVLLWQLTPTLDPALLDVNGDGQVTVIDLAIVALFYGTRAPAGTLPADVKADGIVDILDLTAVAQGIDAARSGLHGLSLEDIEAALLAAADIEVVAEAPNALSRRNLAYRNVAAALADAQLDKRIPETVLKELLHLLTEMREIPDTTALLPNYPNPFNPETWIPYHLATDAAVVLTIHDVRGALVRELTLGHQPAGIYQSKHRAAYWDGRNQNGEPVASSVYFYTLTAGDFTATRKLLIAK